MNWETVLKKAPDYIGGYLESPAGTYETWRSYVSRFRVLGRILFIDMKWTAFRMGDSNLWHLRQGNSGLGGVCRIPMEMCSPFIDAVGTVRFNIGYLGGSSGSDGKEDFSLIAHALIPRVLALVDFDYRRVIGLKESLRERSTPQSQ